MTKRTTKAQIDNLVATLEDLTGATLGYTHAYGNQYQLYLEDPKEKRIERTLGGVALGAGNFYDTLNTAIDLIRVYIEREEENQNEYS